MAGGMTQKRPEAKFQRVVTNYLAVILPKTVWFSAIGHGGGGVIRGAQLKAAGVRAGVPDIMLIHEGRVYFCELKTGYTRVSQDQKDCHAAILAAGGKVEVCRHLDEVTDCLKRWGIPTLQIR